MPYTPFSKEENGMEKKEYINQTSLLERGWTKSMIAKLLPMPILKNNPYNSKSKIKIWELETVLEVEQSTAFADAMSAAEKRKASAKKATETRFNNLMAIVQAAIDSTHIKKLDDETLRRRAILHAKERYLKKSGNDYFDGNNLEEATICRWVVNYIRHQFVKCNYHATYDNVLYNFRGKLGKDKLYLYYKSALLDKICAAYPKYADECREQKEKTELSILYME